MDLTLGLAAAKTYDPLLPLWAMELLAQVFFYVWLFCLGGTVGSFLNVVVYRLPRGKNLAFPGSSCPQCGHAIRLDDNIPILSWLVLRGRCRDCRTRIPARYFFVELTVASLFLLVLAGERWPLLNVLAANSRPPLTLHDGVPFWVTYATHVSLLTTLLAAVLIRSDGFSVPAGLFVPSLLLGFVPPLVWPNIRSLPAIAYGEWNDWQVGLTDGMAGMAAGLILAFAVGLWRLQTSGQWPKFAPLALGASIGVVMGWQRTLWAFPLAALVLAVVARSSPPPYPDGIPPERPTEPPADESPTAEPTAALTPHEIEEEIHIVPPCESADPPP